MTGENLTAFIELCHLLDTRFKPNMVTPELIKAFKAHGLFSLLTPQEAAHIKTTFEHEPEKTKNLRIGQCGVWRICMSEIQKKEIAEKYKPLAS